MNILSVKDKTILLTGAAGYLGSAMGAHLMEQGANVIGMSRSKKVHDLGYYKSYNFDFNDDILESVLNEILDIRGMPAIDALINNAYDLSANTGFGPLKTQSHRTTWDNAFNSFYWTVKITDALLKSVIDNNLNNVSIINISSMYSKIVPDPNLYNDTLFNNPVTYGPMKAALNSYTKRIAAVFGKYGVRCNAVLPGAFPNALVQDEKFLQRLRDKSVLGRTGKPEELVGIIQYLTSDASSFTTGQEFIIDGGWTII